MNIVMVDESNYEAFSPIIPHAVLDGDVLVMGAVNDSGVIMGVCVAQILKEAINVAYLWVDEDCRRQGIANALLDKVDEVRTKVYNDVPIVSFYDTNEEYAYVYNHMFTMRGYELSSNRRSVYIISKERMMDSPLFARANKDSKSYTSVRLDNLSNSKTNELIEHLNINDTEMAPTHEDFNDIDKTKSYALYIDGKPEGVFLSDHVKSTGVYVINYVYLNQGHAMEGIKFFRGAIRKLVGESNDMELLMFTCINEKIEDALKSVFGEDIYLEEYYEVEAISA